MRGVSPRTAVAGALIAACTAALGMQTASPADAADAGAPAEDAGGGGPHRVDRDGVSLEIAPLSMDQTRAFLVARGFTEADARLAAERGCFFRSAIANSATAAEAPLVDIALPTWRVTPAQAAAGAPPMTRESWAEFWSRRGVSEAAAVAFHWALFPTEQSFAATDHNWGFLTFGLPGGTRFALDVEWRVAGAARAARIDGLECAR